MLARCKLGAQREVFPSSLASSSSSHLSTIIVSTTHSLRIYYGSSPIADGTKRCVLVPTFLSKDATETNMSIVPLPRCRPRCILCPEPVPTGYVRPPSTLATLSPAGPHTCTQCAPRNITRTLRVAAPVCTKYSAPPYTEAHAIASSPLPILAPNVGSAQYVQ